LLIIICVWGYLFYSEAHKSEAERQQELARKQAQVEEYAKAAQAREADRQRQQMNREQAERDLKSSAESAVTAYIPLENPRAEIENGNLIIYIRKTDFQSIPFPDQPKFRSLDTVPMDHDTFPFPLTENLS
jgi:hypothetical protein